MKYAFVVLWISIVLLIVIFVPMFRMLRYSDNKRLDNDSTALIFMKI